MLVLGLESSCDETAAAIAANGRVVAESVRSQIDLHQKYGGVVPEIASRAHLEAVEDLAQAVLRKAGLKLENLDGLAVTLGPGLVGALLVAVNFAKGLALATKLPLTGVNHVKAHAQAPFLYTDSPNPPTFPYVALVASGGHTSLFLVEDHLNLKVLGQTLDDAAGEAFDKFAKLLGLGYPGGAVVEKLAAKGRKEAYQLARPLIREGLNFSFSGLKTQVRLLYEAENLDNRPHNHPDLANLAASFQEAVIEVLVAKLLTAVKMTGATGAVLAGGVACNGALREAAQVALSQINRPLWTSPVKWCADNGAMIAFLGAKQLEKGQNLLDLAAEAQPRWAADSPMPTL
jgi:N6-L-threonylcarbamoyladenine synthase